MRAGSWDLILLLEVNDLVGEESASLFAEVAVLPVDHRA